MGAYVMPSNRGARCSAVPQPRSKYAPPGYHRCKECNALVKDRSRHKCHVEPYREPQKVRIKHQRPQKVEKPDKKKANWRSLYLSKAEPDENTLACTVCGGKYKDSSIGRVSKMCPKCRKSKSQDEA